MFSFVLDLTEDQKIPEPKEGDLYKVITAFGKRFEIYYGYYEESDKLSPYGKPIELYPNFSEYPVYTDKGIPFVTAMQKSCKYFKGDASEDEICFRCTYYEKCEELLGICKCSKKRIPKK